MNQALMSYFPNRTVEAIKGRRRYLKHKEAVQQFLAELRAGRNRKLPVSAAGTADVESIIALKTAFTNIISKLNPLKGSELRADKLGEIYSNVLSSTQEEIAAELNAYLLEVFPPKPDNAGPQPAQIRERRFTKRQIRRPEYAKTKRHGEEPVQVSSISLEDEIFLPNTLRRNNGNPLFAD